MVVILVVLFCCFSNEVQQTGSRGGTVVRVLPPQVAQALVEKSLKKHEYTGKRRQIMTFISTTKIYKFHHELRNVWL